MLLILYFHFQLNLNFKIITWYTCIATANATAYISKFYFIFHHRYLSLNSNIFFSQILFEAFIKNKSIKFLRLEINRRLSVTIFNWISFLFNNEIAKFKLDSNFIGYVRTENKDRILILFLLNKKFILYKNIIIPYRWNY